MTISLNEALSSKTSIKPDQIGETVGGTITGTKVQQVSDYATGEAEFWPSGEPKNQLVVSLTTPEGEEGAAYVKLWGEQRKALMQAIRETGLEPDNALAPGNELWITFVREEPNQKNPRFNATKIYEYKIKPRANLGNALSEPAQAQPQAPVQPQVQQAQPVNVNQLIQAGLTNEQIAQATGLDTSVIELMRNNAA